MLFVDYHIVYGFIICMEIRYLQLIYMEKNKKKNLYRIKLESEKT